MCHCSSSTKVRAIINKTTRTTTKSVKKRIKIYKKTQKKSADLSLMNIENRASIQKDFLAFIIKSLKVSIIKKYKENEKKKKAKSFHF